MASEDFTPCGPPELVNFVPLPRDPAFNPQGMHQLDESSSDEEDYDSGGSDSDADHPMGLTENGALTFVTSGSPCLDFFFQVVPKTPKRQITDLLTKAWEENPLMTLKLLFHLRGIRGTGKSDKLSFYDGACWLYENHPSTLTSNVAKVPQFGYYKDLLELLQRIVEGPEETALRMSEKAAHNRRKSSGKKAALRRKIEQKHAQARRRKTEKAAGYYARKGAAARAAKEAGTLKPREERVAEDIERGKAAKEAAAVLRKNKNLKLASRVVEKHKSDPEFAKLYNSVAKLFAEALAKDLEALKEHGPKKARISLAAKWCPSLDSSYDRQTLLCEGIACHYFPRSGFDGQLTQYDYIRTVRAKLHKEVLVPLRSALQLPEVYMSAREWSSLPYTRVASVAMKRYKEFFLKHDEERFKGYLDQVEKGEKKIASGALLPHEIVKDAIQSGEEARVAELQWRSMVEEMKKSGDLADSISICDVSGSMFGEPIEVSIALGLLTSELSEEPWKGKLITFSNEPAFHEVTGNTLREKYEFVSRMPWDMNTDFQKVFDLLLKMARENKLPSEKMVKRLFVYSDMEFDHVAGRTTYDYERGKVVTTWETDYGQICRKFEEAGYGTPPEIVFWNLRSTQSTPVMKGQKGVALVSGFSKNLLKLFINNNGQIEPMLILNQAISGSLFDDLVVMD